MALISALFSADQSTYEAAIAFIKNISGESGRKEAIRHLLLAFFRLHDLCSVLGISACGKYEDIRFGPSSAADWHGGVGCPL